MRNSYILPLKGCIDIRMQENRKGKNSINQKKFISNKQNFKNQTQSYNNKSIFKVRTNYPSKIF